MLGGAGRRSNGGFLRCRSLDLAYALAGDAPALAYGFERLRSKDAPRPKTVDQHLAGTVRHFSRASSRALPVEGELSLCFLVEALVLLF